MCALDWYKYSLLLFPSDATSNKNIAKLQVFNPLAVSFNMTCLLFYYSSVIVVFVIYILKILVR